jgi:hypothetical protein
VGRLRTTRDDSDRVRGPLSPGHSLSVINRAGLAALADRLSQSRSQHGGRSPLITRILLSIPARPDCFTHVVALTNPPYSDTHYPPRRAEQSHHTQSPIPPSLQHCHSPSFHSATSFVRSEHETKRRRLELDLACRAASSQTHSPSLQRPTAVSPLADSQPHQHPLLSHNTRRRVAAHILARYLPISPLPSEAVLWQRRRAHHNQQPVSPQSAPTPAQARRLIHTATETSTSRLWAFNAATPHTHL